jgi:hypothetical protein
MATEQKDGSCALACLHAQGCLKPAVCHLSWRHRCLHAVVGVLHQLLAIWWLAQRTANCCAKGSKESLRAG